MIESTLKLVDGVKFYTYRIVPPIEKRHGIPVELVDHYHDPLYKQDVSHTLRSLGYRKIAFDLDYLADVYARWPHWWIPLKVLESVYQAYWWTLRFLYNNARMFKQIPAGQRFSWRYFTPYTWFKKP